MNDYNSNCIECDACRVSGCGCKPIYNRVCGHAATDVRYSRCCRDDRASEEAAACIITRCLHQLLQKDCLQYVRRERE